MEESKSSAFETFILRMGAWLRSKGFLPNPADAFANTPADEAFMSLWGKAPKEASDELYANLSSAGIPASTFYSAGLWSNVLGSVVVMVQSVREDSEMLTHTIKRTVKNTIRIRKLHNPKITVFVYLKDEASEGHLPHGSTLICGLRPVRVNFFFFSEPEQRIFCEDKLPLPEQEFEQQAFGKWSGWMKPSLEETGGREMFVIKLPEFAFVDTALKFARSMGDSAHFSYNELTPAQPLKEPVWKLLKRFRHVLALEGMGEIMITAGESSSQFMITGLHEMFVINPMPIHEKLIHTLPWGETKDLYQRSGRLNQGDRRPGVKILRERYKHMDFFSEFLQAFHIELKLPPGYEQAPDVLLME